MRYGMTPRQRAPKAGEILRSLVKEIILTPDAGELKIDVRTT